MALFFLGMALSVWMVCGSEAFRVPALGLFWFLVALIVLGGLLIVLAVMWCLDTGLGHLVDWLGEHCEDFE